MLSDACPFHAADCFLPTAYCSPNGGFVPDFSDGRRFVIKQIGGFVFWKGFTFQISAYLLTVLKLRTANPKLGPQNLITENRLLTTDY